MTIYNLYIFTKRGACVHYAEWARPHAALASSGAGADEDAKLMFGLLFSLKALMNKMAPNPEPPTQLPAFGPDQGFYRYATDAYVLFHLEAPTGWKLALTCDAAAGDLRPALWTVYSEILAHYALKNPLYVPGSPITNVGFVAAVDGFIRGLPAFAAK
jgi:hypothetical protein